MARHRALASIGLLIVCQLACGGAPTPSSGLRTAGPQTPPPNISISPTGAPAGSGDVTMTVTGSQNFIFTNAGRKFSQVIWSQNGTNTNLATTFVSSTQLTALVPALLLANALQAKVRVEIWDIMGDAPGAVSSSVPFTVASSSAPFISSISPATVAAGSADLTITITGTSFDNQFLHETVAFLTTDPNNLHDHGIMLNTRFVSSNQVTAVIPGQLLQKTSSVQLVVLVGDSMGMSDGYFGYPESNAVTFTVTP